MNIFDLTFGVEFECYLPEGKTMADAARAVSRRIGKTVQTESYNHRAADHWKVVTDASLGDAARGCEFVSPALPPLSGEAGLIEVERVCEALSDFGCTVSRKCGLHAHIGARGQPLSFFKNIVKLYALYEGVIDDLMPESRRRSENGFCRSMTSASHAAIDSVTTLESLITIATPRIGSMPGSERYYKVNLKAFARHGTVEFRQHSGTLEPRKVRNWLLTCLRMVAKAIDGIEFGGVAQSPTNRARPSSKAYKVGQMLLRPEGVTRSEVMAALNWPSVSIPQQAGICGIEYTSQRTGREVRYFARRTETQSLDVSLEGLCNLIGSSDSEREYLRARTENLSGPVQWAA